MQYLAIIIFLFSNIIIFAQNNYNLITYDVRKEIRDGQMHIFYKLNKSDIRVTTIGLLLLNSNGGKIHPNSNLIVGDYGRKVKIKSNKTYKLVWSFESENEKYNIESLIPVVLADAEPYILRSQIFQPYLGGGLNLSDIRIFSNGNLDKKITSIPEFEMIAGIRLFRALNFQTSYSHSYRITDYENEFYSRVAFSGSFYIPLWSQRFRTGLEFGEATFYFFHNSDRKIKKFFGGLNMEYFINMHLVFYCEARLNDSEVFNTYSMGSKYYF